MTARGPALILAALLLGVSPAPAVADPLDRVSGTESWRQAGTESIESEWKDWYRARVAWRRARRELWIQRQRNQQLAWLLHRSRGRPNLQRARRIIRNNPRRVRRPAPRARVDADAILRQGGQDRRPIKVYNPGPAPVSRRGEPAGARTPEPPSWVKVPVERLDNSGQAIDDEGDRVLQNSGKK